MTLEEMNFAIAEKIIPQEKPKSTGNSHRRKQWENKKNWHLCTKWKSCKVGKAKKCELVGKIDRKIYYKSCEDCFCFWENPRFYNRLAGVSFDCLTGRFEKYSYNSTSRRRYVNRWVRRYANNVENELGNYGYYRKIFEYAWDCV